MKTRTNSERSITRSSLSKKRDDECPCIRHKNELNQLLDTAYLTSSNQEKDEACAHDLQACYPVEQTVQYFLQQYQVEEKCKTCIRIYVNLLSAPSEQISEAYLSSAHHRCFPSRSKKLSEQKTSY
jgi:hypothetical protein